MRLPVITGLIKRRILVNFRADPGVVQGILPAGFAPKLHEGRAIVGICLIRLERIRPRFVPFPCGINSENAAHRIAVTWQDAAGLPREGVFIPRRDTSSRLNHLAGGTVFPGEHHLATFAVSMTQSHVDLRMNSRDGLVALSVRGRRTTDWPQSSSFSSLQEASQFFEPGAVGYSVTADKERLDGIELRTKTWTIAPLAIEAQHSSYYSDEARFPHGTIEFDCALFMENIEHEWHSAADMYV